jgi:hypothetical protein
VSIGACVVSVGTESLIPAMAGLPALSRNRPLRLKFCVPRSSGILEPEHGEVGKVSMVGKKEVLSLGHSKLNSFVKLNDSGMLRYREGGKGLLDVFPIWSQFGRIVEEDVDCGLQCGVVGNDPFGVRLDCLGWRYQTCDKLEISEFLLSLVIKGNRVERGEDLVKIDCLPQKEVGPFHVRELWTAWGVNKQGLCEFDVSQEVLQC